MNSSLRVNRFRHLAWVFLPLVLAGSVPAWSQLVPKLPAVPPRQAVPKPVRPVPVRPTPRVVPAKAQPQVAQRRTQPQRGVKPGTIQPTTPIDKGPGNGNRGERQIGTVRRPGALDRGVSQPAVFRTPPNARSVPIPGGGARVFHPDGRRWVVDRDNHVTEFSRPGMQAKFKADGSLSSVLVNQQQGGKMLVGRSLHGPRQTLWERPGGVYVATFGKDRGFVQRPCPGRAGFAQRTYVVGGVPSVYVYRVARYRGTIYLHYVPAYSYPAGFYAWISNPWPTPVSFGWGGPHRPALSFYSSYFVPEQAYPAASLWLTDFVLAQDLQRAYESHQEYQSTPQGAPASAEAAADNAPLTPEVKGDISQEVQAQVLTEQTDSAQPNPPTRMAANQALPPALDPNQRTFVVSENLEVNQATAPCMLTPGDVIYRTADNVVNGNKVGVKVVSSKAGDCDANSPAEVELGALQEMLNQFRQQIDAGLAKLAASQGHGGLPSGPPSDARADPAGTGQADADAGAILEQQQNAADLAESSATDGANGANGNTMM